jgi:hypothetical protein
MLCVRLLDVHLLLGRLPLLEATDMAEARLCITVLNALIASATAVRGTLAALAQRRPDEGQDE